MKNQYNCRLDGQTQTIEGQVSGMDLRHAAVHFLTADDSRIAQVKGLGVSPDVLYEIPCNDDATFTTAGQGWVLAIQKVEAGVGDETSGQVNCSTSAKPRETATNVSFEELALDDSVIIWDRGHSAHGARGKVYWLDPETRMVSVTTSGCVDTWEGYADGLQKLVVHTQ